MPNVQTGPSTTQTPYLVETEPNVRFVSLLSAGDKIGTRPDGVTPWSFVGVPDGLGAFSNGNGTATILVNHEIGGTAGVTRDDGFKGSFVDQLTVNTSTYAVTAASDLAKQLYVADAAGTGYVLANPAGSGLALTGALARLCSGDLPSVSAFYNAASGKGTQDRIYMTGEENGTEGRPFAWIVTGADAGKAFELPRFGNLSIENEVASPFSGDKTVVSITDDATPGQVYIYVGDKLSTGSTLDRAGLTDGQLYGIKASFAVEASSGTPLAGSFTLAPLGDVSGSTGAQLQAASTAAGVTEWLRPEDSTWDAVNPNRLFFQTTNAFAAPSRLWELDFTDVKNPTLGGTFAAVLDGTEGHRMLDNLTSTAGGSFLPASTQINLEDVGNNARNGRVWSYDPATDVFTQIARHDPARFGDDVSAATAPFNQDEETSGVVDVTAIFGNANTNAFLIDDQAHYTAGISTEVVEGGQLLLMLVDRPVNGGAGNDAVNGSQFADTLDAGAGNDVIRLGSGNDTVTPGTGNDTVDGGPGRDTVNVSAQFGLRGTATSTVAGTTTMTNRGETDTLTNVEVVRFADGRMVYDATDPIAEVTRLYAVALDRVADQGGLNGFAGAIAGGTSGAAVAGGLVASAEFGARFGANLGNDAFVEQMYVNALDRASDAGGRAFWVSQLAGGATRGAVVLGMADSAEHVAKTAGIVAGGIWDRSETAMSVARLYDATLDRLPDFGGFNGFRTGLDAGTTTLRAAAGAALGSAEYVAKHGITTNAQFVEDVYHDALGRAADAASKTSWVDMLNSGVTRAEVLVSISESPEHVALTAAATGGETPNLFGVLFA